MHSVGDAYIGYTHKKGPGPYKFLIGSVAARGCTTLPAAFTAIAVHSIGKLSFNVTLWNNLNVIKRESTFLVACWQL